MIGIVARMRVWLGRLRVTLDDPFDYGFPDSGPDSRPDSNPPIPDDIFCPTPEHPSPWRDRPPSDPHEGEPHR